MSATTAVLPAKATQVPDYIRYREDRFGRRLELAIKSFRLPSGQIVDLVGAVHIADAAYYQKLNERFSTYDAVLFEMVGDPTRLTDDGKRSKMLAGGPSKSTISFIQTALAGYLGLQFQLREIDYTKPNMVHADATAQEFAAMQQVRGESMIGLLIRARSLVDSEPNGGAMKGFDSASMMRMLLARDSASEFKIALAKMFDQIEAYVDTFEGTAGSAILGDRNLVILKTVKRIASDKRKRRIAIFFGAAHMPGVEALLRKSFRVQADGELWLTGWHIP